MKMTKNAKPIESLHDLISLTDKESPKAEDLAKLRKFLDEDDQLVRLNEASEHAFTMVTETYSTSALTRELYKRQIEAKRKEMDYQSENVMVQMMINQVILCHIRLNTFETFHAKKTRENLSVASGLYWDKLLSNYQRRFLKACESLAKVRKLLSEAGLRDQQTKNKRSQSSLNSARIYKAMSD